MLEVLLLAVAAVAAAPAEPALDPELMEFIGEWTDEQGRDVDPFAVPQVKKEAGDAPNKNADKPKSEPQP